MEDDSEPPPGVEVRQNLNDLQSYLVHFNKEIGNNDTNSFQQKFISQMISASQSEKSSPSEEELPAISGEKSGSEPMIEDDLSESHISLSEVGVHKYEVMDELSSVSSDIVELSANAVSSLVDENQTPTEVEGLQGMISSGNVMMIPVSSASSILGGQKVVQLVNVNGTPTLQIVSSETQLPSTDVVSPAAEQIKALVEQIAGAQTPASTTVQTPTPSSVVVIPSVATNTLAQFQANVSPAQAAVVKSSTDDTQPQLVAIQTEDGSIYGVTNVSQPSVLTQTVPTVVSAVSDVPTAPLVAQATSPTLDTSQLPADGNYILIVNASGEKDQGKVYDFGGNLRGEVVEEITEPDGTTKRLVRVVQLPQVIQAQQTDSAVEGIPFGDQLMCNYCNYTSPKRYLLSRHMKSHSEDRPHKCTICTRGFKSLASLHNHINVHMGVKPHKCKSCESEFTTSGELIRHIRYKHTFEKPHKCSECDYASVELSKLKRHVRSHTGERPYQCTRCDYASPDTYKLKRHMRIHTGEKPYECDVCKARFTQSNSLKAHKLIHSGNKPVFQCTFCPTTCGRRTDLKIHIQKLHSTDTAQICKRCGADFPDRYQYKVHLKTHEGERYFKCNLCYYAGYSLKQLNIHQAMHTSGGPFKCTECKYAFKSRRTLLLHRQQYHLDKMTPEEIKEAQEKENEMMEEGEEEQECAACLKIYERYRLSEGEKMDDEEELEHTCGTVIKSVSSYTADQLIENSLLADMKQGKLGTSPKVVVVHPDGRIEEVTAKLQSLSQANSKPVDDFLVSLGVSDHVSHIIADATADDSNSSTADVISGESSIQQSAVSQSTLADNQSAETSQTDFSSENQTPATIKIEVQSASEDLTSENEDEAEFTAECIEENQKTTVIKYEKLKEAGTQATIDSEEEQKVIVTRAQPQIVKIIPVSDIDTEPDTETTPSTIIVASGDCPDVNTVYVSLLQKHNTSPVKEEKEQPKKRQKLSDDS